MFSTRFVICVVYFAQLVREAQCVAPEEVVGIFMTDVILECRKKFVCVSDPTWWSNGKKVNECNDKYCLKEDDDLLILEVRNLSLDQIKNRYKCDCPIYSGLRETAKSVTIRGQCQALTSVNGNPMTYNGSYPRIHDEKNTVALMEGDSFDMHCLQDGALLSNECPWTSGNQSVVTMDLDQCTHTCILNLGGGEVCIVEVLTFVITSTTARPLTSADVSSKTMQEESPNAIIPTTLLGVTTPESATIPPSTQEQLSGTTGSKTTQGELLNRTIPTALLVVESSTILPSTPGQLPPTTKSTTTAQHSGSSVQTNDLDNPTKAVKVQISDLDPPTEAFASPSAASITEEPSLLPQIIFVLGSTFIILFLLLITILWRFYLIYVEKVDGKEPDVYSPKSFYRKPKTSNRTFATGYRTLPKEDGGSGTVCSPATSTDTWRSPTRVSSPASSTDTWRIPTRVSSPATSTDTWRSPTRVSSPAASTDTWRTPTRVSSPATSTDTWRTPKITIEEDRHTSASPTQENRTARKAPWSADNWRKPTSSVKKRYESMVRKEDPDREPYHNTDDRRMSKSGNGRNHFNLLVEDVTSATTLL